MHGGRLGAVGVVEPQRFARRQPRLLIGIVAPIGEVGRRGDADQCRDPLLAQTARRQQHEPTTHRRADEHDRRFHARFDQLDRLAAPAAERAIGERARAFTAAGVIEQQASPPGALGPFEQGRRLAAGHVGHVAGQEHDRRASPAAMAKGDPAPVGKRVKAGFRHRSAMPRHASLGKGRPRRRSEGAVVHQDFGRRREDADVAPQRPAGEIL